MSQKITKKDLQAVVDRINRETQQALYPWAQGPKGSIANVGNFHLNCAYGGYQLTQMVNKEGGCRDVLFSGHVKASELYHLMHAFLRGLDYQRQPYVGKAAA